MSFLACLTRGKAPSSHHTSDEKCVASSCGVITPFDTTARLTQLRALMKDSKIDIYLVPSVDAHSSEYVADCDKRRAFISGFTGSAGTAIITMQEAFLFTDSRYYIQASKQLDQNWYLYKVGLANIKDWLQWLVEDAPPHSRIGVDPFLLSQALASQLNEGLKQRSCKLAYLNQNLVDCVWGRDRPLRSERPLKVHDIKFAGESCQDKVKRLRQQLSTQKSDAYLTSSLADIAWILNIRESEQITLFIESVKVEPKGHDYLREVGVGTQSYDGIVPFLQNLDSFSIVTSDQSISTALATSIARKLIIQPSLIAEFKAVKNKVEIEGFRKAYLRDASAWCRWAAWLEEGMKCGPEINEWQAAEALTDLRKQLPYYSGLAYENISATNENAALAHYGPTKDIHRIIDRSTPYLNDSGPQYLDGTIDTTRTVHFGKATKEQKLAYTVVLKGHIAVASMTFPVGTTGSQLDTLARSPGWKHGLTYGHGTGHGIGSFGGVHEGPQGLSPRSNIAFKPGHTSTIEPGYYSEGKFGIRIENCYVVQQQESGWLKFERFTQVPISNDLVDWTLMTEDEVKWLKQHNHDCVEAVLPLISDDKRAVDWLKRQR